MLQQHNLTDSERELFNTLVAEGMTRDTPEEEPPQCTEYAGIPITLTELSPCSGLTNIEERVQTQRCVKPKSELIIPGQLRLKMNYDQFKDNEELSERLLTAIGDDIALNLGAESDEIVNREFEAVASGHQMRVLATGVLYNFGLQSSSDDDTRTLASRLDALLQTGAFTMPSTTEVVTDLCPNTCVDSLSDLTSLAEVGTPVPFGTPEPTDDDSSGSLESISALLLGLVTIAFLTFA
jgi:hypothetical protein